MLFWMSTGAAVVVLFLCWNLYQRFGADRIAALSEKRRTTSRIVSRGEFFDGNRRIEVALALTRDTLHYENADMEASLDLQWVREIEYDTRLATGAAIAGGKVLRLRCYSQTFEFLLPDDMVARWHLVLPPRRETALAGKPAVGGLAVTAAGRP
jgi:hypothetical protein